MTEKVQRAHIEADMAKDIVELQLAHERAQAIEKQAQQLQQEHQSLQRRMEWLRSGIQKCGSFLDVQDVDLELKDRESSLSLAVAAALKAARQPTAEVVEEQPVE